MTAEPVAPPMLMADLDETMVRRVSEIVSAAVAQKEPPPPPPHPVRDIVLPLAVVIGLIGNAWWGGVGWGKVSTQLETILATLANATTTVAQHEKEITQLEARITAQEKELRLFKMYTKGRIARLPYRSSDDGE